MIWSKKLQDDRCFQNCCWEELTMKKKRCTLLALIALLVIVSFTLLDGSQIHAAYNHQGDIDSENFRTAYPDKVGTKLDSCTLCHGGTPQDVKPTLGSCQYCHDVTKYGDESTPENLLKTLNSYGLDYLKNGRTTAALLALGSDDSDSDDYTNHQEIMAGTYPGDGNDDPSKQPAPAIVFSLEQLERMPRHNQFLLMNASKSDDSYTEYGGVALENLIGAIMLEEATGATVYSPDGFYTYHPFTPSTNINSYHVFGTYPAGTFHYDERADIAMYPLILLPLSKVVGVIIVPLRPREEKTSPTSSTRKV
jgi:hypothetical protein